MQKATYARALGNKTLSGSAVGDLIAFIESRGMKVEDLPAEILRRARYRSKLKFGVCRGNRSWEGLVVGFPGARQDLSTENVGTPFLRKILYPMLLLHRSLGPHYSRPMACLYLLGDRFNDVFLRKFRFLSALVPHVIVVSKDLQNWAGRKAGHVPGTPQKKRIDETYLQWSLCAQMSSPDGLNLPSNSGESIRTGLLSYEVPTVAGNWKTERLDILGYDRDDSSLVAFEIKGPDAGRPELENLFFQGLEHQNWLEANKMALKFALEGPRGTRINTRKRVKLVLGFCEDKKGGGIPELFYHLRAEALRKDRFLRIEFCRLISPAKGGGEVRVGRFE